MPLPLLRLQPISTSHYHISGDVVIADGAAIAPGVLLQADPNSRVVIKAGACIGVGSILHAHNGTVEIGEGANVGAEVLLVGHVIVGDRACIGSATTILNSSVALGEVIPPGSLIGDSSQSQTELPVLDTVVVTEAAVPNGATTPLKPEANTPPPPSTPQSAAESAGSGVSVYGQMYVNQMFVKMFPHHNPASHHSANSDKPALSEDPWDD